MSPLVPVSDIEKMAGAVAKSGLFGIKTTEQAMALMLIAQAEGLHPAIAARDYHVIQGKPALKADAILARFQTAGGKVEWTDYTDARVCGIFSHPQGGKVEIAWTIEQAKKIGLLSKEVWKHYPRAMLRARVISEGVRTVYPGVVVGVYTPEEIDDIPPARTYPKDMGSAEVMPSDTEQTKPVLSDSQIADHSAAIDGAATLEELKAVYATAYRAAQALNDVNAAKLFQAAKDVRKKVLEGKPTAEDVSA